MKILSGTFNDETWCIGCGVMIEYKAKIYHLLVVKDRKTDKPCIELNGKVFFAKDIEEEKQSEKH